MVLLPISAAILVPYSNFLDELMLILRISAHNSDHRINLGKATACWFPASLPHCHALDTIGN